MRVCAACDSTTTYTNPKTGHMQWHIHDGYWFCHKCFEHYIHGPIYAPVRNAKWNPINSVRRQLYKYKSINHKKNPRKGICELCGAIKGINCKQTNLHHIDYHDDDPLKDTIELCASCHMKESWKLGQLT